MSDDDMNFSRIGPPDVEPVAFEGRRDVQVVNGEGGALDPRTGDLAVSDVPLARGWRPSRSTPSRSTATWNRTSRSSSSCTSNCSQASAACWSRTSAACASTSPATATR
jgi:hypothetical protein